DRAPKKSPERTNLPAQQETRIVDERYPIGLVPDHLGFRLRRCATPAQAGVPLADNNAPPPDAEPAPPAPAPVAALSAANGAPERGSDIEAPRTEPAAAPAPTSLCGGGRNDADAEPPAHPNDVADVAAEPDVPRALYQPASPS